MKTPDKYGNLQPKTVQIIYRNENAGELMNSKSETTQC